MTHPEWALKHKKKGTELRCIRGKYYLYEITSKWDKEAKKTKKITLRQLGTITEEHGLVATGLKKRGRPSASGSVFKENVFDELNDKINKNKLQSASIVDACLKLEDPRSMRNQLHSVSELLFLTLMALICDADGWQDIETYGRMRQDYLRDYFDYQTMPSDDTLRRFCTALDPKQFKNLFQTLTAPLLKHAQAKLLSIDGKVSRGSFDGADEKAIHMVSAFSSETRIVLGQEKVADKSNEITAIPKILEWLDVKDHIITIDAMGCQYAIADQIIGKKGDYIFSLKGNQGNLSDDVRHYFEDVDAQKKSPKELEEEHQISTNCNVDKGHGRIETRACSVCQNVSWLHERHPKWTSIKSIIQVKSIRELKNKNTEETRYFISSLTVDASTMNAYIRSHWAIENSLHWVLDMTFKEDQSRIRKNNAPQIMAILRHLILNAFQSYRASLPKSEKISIRGLRKMCAWDPNLGGKILSRLFS